MDKLSSVNPTSRHTSKLQLNWQQYEQASDTLASNIYKHFIACGLPLSHVYGVHRGGVLLADRISRRLNVVYSSINSLEDLMFEPHAVIIDDIIDSGDTMSRILKHSPGAYVVSWVVKSHSSIVPSQMLLKVPANTWVIFSWEVEAIDGKPKT